MGDELLGLCDRGRFRAGQSGRAEAQLDDAHGRVCSDDAVSDDLDVTDRRAAGEDMAV